MEQISLFESVEERQRREEEVRNPLLLVRRTSAHVGWLLMLSLGLAALELVVIRAMYGMHDQDQEIVVISTPLVLGYLCVRVLRTQITPADQRDISNVPKPSFQEALSGFFALSLLLLTLLIVSGLVYRHFEIQWATQAVYSWVRRWCVGMTGLAGLIFIASEQGRRQMRRVVRIWIAVPALCGSVLASLVPKGRKPIWH